MQAGSLGFSQTRKHHEEILESVVTEMDKSKLVRSFARIELLKVLPKSLKEAEAEVQNNFANAWKLTLEALKEKRKNYKPGTLKWTGKTNNSDEQSVNGIVNHGGVAGSKSTQKVKVTVTARRKSAKTTIAPVIEISSVEIQPRMIYWTNIDSNIKLPQRMSVEESGVHGLECDQKFLKLCDTLFEYESKELNFGRERQKGQSQIFEALGEFFKPDDGTFPEKLKARYKELTKQNASRKPEVALPSIPSAKMRDMVMNTFMNYFCRRCFLYNCLIHGADEKVKLGKDQLQQGYITPFFASRKPCGQGCWKVNITRGLEMADEVECREWTEDEKAIYVAVARLYLGNPCEVARIIISKTCYQVYKYWERMKAQDGDFDQGMALPRHKLLKKRPGKNLQKFPEYCKKNRLLMELKDETSPDVLSYPIYRPCNHIGACVDPETCNCIRNKIVCEKYCSCCHENLKCKNLFPGCSCKGSCKIKNTCPCLAAGRECDMDMCNCAMENCRSEPLKENPCDNASIQMKLGARVRLAESGVAGWGLFTEDAMKAGDFVGEYVGELISLEETKMRTIQNARVGYTYLCTKDADHFVDAMTLGNYMRFINSADPNDVNCEAVSRTVKGDYRIGLYATKDIEPNTELFFDYQAALETQRNLLEPEEMQ